MCNSLLPSRPGFALALAALLMPVAINRASTIDSHTLWVGPGPATLSVRLYRLSRPGAATAQGARLHLSHVKPQGHGPMRNAGTENADRHDLDQAALVSAPAALPSPRAYRRAMTRLRRRGRSDSLGAPSNAFTFSDGVLEGAAGIAGKVVASDERRHDEGALPGPSRRPNRLQRRDSRRRSPAVSLSHAGGVVHPCRCMDSPGLDDSELLRRARMDVNALGAFYRRHARAVYRSLLGDCGDPDVALDLTAETFARALQSPGRFRGLRVTSGRAWIFARADARGRCRTAGRAAQTAPAPGRRAARHRGAADARGSRVRGGNARALRRYRLAARNAPRRPADSAHVAVRTAHRRLGALPRERRPAPVTEVPPDLSRRDAGWGYGGLTAAVRGPVRRSGGAGPGARTRPPPLSSWRALRARA
jgi:DNA-directed RNA polymerase specialized sigma24 family protein